MNSLTRIMSYDKTKIKNQENCNCKECISVKNTELENQIEYPKLSEEEIEQIIQKIFILNDQYLKLEIDEEAKKQMVQFISFLICYFNSKDVSDLSNKIQINQLNSFPPNSFFGIWAMEIAHSLKITDGWEESIIKGNSILVEETIKRYYLRREAYYEDILECQGQD